MNLTYSPRPDSASQAHATPASAYTTERRLLARYTELLYACEPEQLMREVWGAQLSDAQMYGSRRGNPGRIDRLDEDVPELIRQLRPLEQAPIDELLAAGELVAAIKKLLGQYRGGARRDTDPRLSEYKHNQTRADWEEDPRQWHNDGWRIKAAGMGKLSREAYGRPLGKPLALTPPLPMLRVQRAHKRAPRKRLQVHPLALAYQLSFWP